jgi:hypothetical protein
MSPVAWASREVLAQTIGANHLIGFMGSPFWGDEGGKVNKICTKIPNDPVNAIMAFGMKCPWIVIFKFLSELKVFP